MPYPNEHSARLKDPDDFDPDSFRRKANGTIYGHIKVPETIDVIWGKLKSANKPDDYPIPQALRFPTKDWTVAEAKKWLKDNDIKYISFEPAEEESRVIDKEIEIRSFKAEIRTDGEENEKPKIKGTAAVFDKPSVDLWGFKEIIHQKSFGSIINTDDVFALINHDANLVLGRNQSGTLFLEENEKGLDFIVDPPDTSYANDLLISMKRKDMDKCSFAFVVSDEYWEKINGETIRHITKFKELWDISIVTYPAFPQTIAELFGRKIKTPQQVYTEYCSRSMESNKLIQQNLTKREQEKRNNTIKLLEKL